MDPKAQIEEALSTMKAEGKKQQTIIRTITVMMMTFGINGEVAIEGGEVVIKYAPT